ncbi:Appr-1-p processing protein [Bremerella cremea]|uniref:Appr-1-p processing protein n=1 Tax=Bremerella cremea TaxID=1031537 RepID=A0A368KNZ1_9BACT|nr:macro domain-containing protein [Bremerella cremea]RCS46287.1 Appr-1-p processing protein [Bremerella cremea]
MSPIQFTNGDATCPIGEGPKIIVHICNDIGGWGAGFVLALSQRWPAPEAAYRRWHAGDEALPFELGQVQFVQVEPQLWVANMIGQRGTRPSDGKPPIRYEAVRQALAKVAQFAQDHSASVHMPRIGCGLAGGKWEEIEPQIEATLLAKDIAVTVYDFG